MSESMGVTEQSIAIGKRIAECRMRKGISAEELSKILGVNRTTLYRYEKGYTARVKPATMRMLAEVLDTSAEYLLTGEIVEKPRAYNIFKSDYKKLDNDFTITAALRDRFTFVQQDDLYREMVSGALRDNFFVLTLSEDICPYIRRGDALLVERENSVVNNRTMVLLFDGVTSIMRVTTMGNTQAFYDLKNERMRIFNKDEELSYGIRIVGCVVECISFI